MSGVTDPVAEAIAKAVVAELVANPAFVRAVAVQLAAELRALPVMAITEEEAKTRAALDEMVRRMTARPGA